jgi:membrane dipeptidase
MFLRPNFRHKDGKEQSPSDLETIADLQRIPAMLKEKGYSENDIEGVMCGNWVRYFTTAWSR